MEKYLKIPSDSPVYGQFMEQKKLISAAVDAAEEYMTKMGASNGCGLNQSRSNVAFGGVYALQFKEKPEGWMHVGEKHQRLFRPKAIQKAVLKEMAELPVVMWKDLCDLIGVDVLRTFSGSRGIHMRHGFGIAWGLNCVLITIEKGVEIDPAVGAIEITVTEHDAEVAAYDAVKEQEKIFERN